MKRDERAPIAMTLKLFCSKKPTKKLLADTQ